MGFKFKFYVLDHGIECRNMLCIFGLRVLSEGLWCGTEGFELCGLKVGHMTCFWGFEF
jgi:hypothetical protein